MAVSATDSTNTYPVPSLRIILSLAMLEIIVPEYISIVIMPAEPSGTLNVLNIDGQAAPKTESGKPNEMNAIYIRMSRI